MKLHENKTLFRQAVQFTSDRVGIPAVFIEKDYWVTLALYTIFTHEVSEYTVFKGGTSLSKCFKLIDRFSEDIDLVLLRDEKELNTNLTAKIKKLGMIVSDLLPEVIIQGLTHKKGMHRKTAHSYNQEIKGEMGQIRNVIVVEASWLGFSEPYTICAVNSLIGDSIAESGQPEIAMEYNLTSFDVKVLEPTRTLCEKIMSMVRFSYSDNAIEVLSRKIRHIYDLNRLLKIPSYNNFFHSDTFNKMLLRVARDDIKSYKNNHQWLEHHPADAMIFKDIDSIWPKLEAVYLNDFRDLVYGPFPDSNQMFETIREIRTRLKLVNWAITV